MTAPHLKLYPLTQQTSDEVVLFITNVTPNPILLLEILDGAAVGSLFNVYANISLFIIIILEQ